MSGNPFPGETAIIIEKHRNGETGEVKMQFLPYECRFVDHNAFTEQPRETYSFDGVNYVSSKMNPPTTKENQPF
jgi:hypothetical protein